MVKLLNGFIAAIKVSANYLAIQPLTIQQ